MTPVRQTGETHVPPEFTSLPWQARPMRLKMVFTAGLLAFASLGCTDKPGLSQTLGKLAHDDGITEIHLDQVTQFAWDEVYFFAPYTPREQVCKTLNILPTDCTRFITISSVDDGQMTLAFVLQHCLMHYTIHDRKNGDFLPMPSPKMIREEDAVFRVVHAQSSNGREWVTLEQKRPARSPGGNPAPDMRVSAH